MSRWLVTVGRGCVGFAVVCAGLAGLVAAVQLGDVLIMSLAVLTLIVLSVSIVGSAAIRAAPRNLVSWILLAAGTAMPLAIASFSYARAAFTHGSELPAPRLAGWLEGWPWVPAMLLVPTIGILLFPDGRLPSPRWRLLLWAECLVVSALLAGVVLQPDLLDFPGVDNPTGLPGSAGSAAHSVMGAIILVAPLSLVSAFAFEWRLRHATQPRERGVLRLVRPAVWLIVLSWWGCVAIGLSGGDTLDALPFEALGMAALGVTAWIAVRRYALFDTRLVIRRGLVYGGLTFSVACVYVLAAGLLASAGAERVAAPLALGIGIGIALPLRDRLQSLANRLVFGLRDDPYATFLQLGDQLEAVARSDHVLPVATRSVREALRLQYVAVEVDGETIASSGQPGAQTPEEFPLIYAGERIGSMLAEPTEGDRPFGPNQRNLLVGLARQIAAVAQAVSLSRDLAKSRERLVKATEDERRRLRRDLHDGLGPTLSSAVLGLRRAHSLVDSRPDVATQQLDALTTQLQQAVAEVRRIVYGLRPSALDELGLIQALDEHAQTLGLITVRGPDTTPTLSAAAEVAVYRIALEAMTNAVRHADARSITVDVTVDDTLHLEIADDGIGLPAEYQAGVGISSMRERAADVGGSCTIEPRKPTGTLVRASVPLETP